jgi:hypothetical protein
MRDPDERSLYVLVISLLGVVVSLLAVWHFAGPRTMTINRLPSVRVSSAADGASSGGSPLMAVRYCSAFEPEKG